MTSLGDDDKAMSRPSTERAVARSAARFLDPVVFILVLAGIFDWLSGNPIHSILLFAAAASLLWEASRVPPDEGRHSASRTVGSGEARSNRAVAPVTLIAAVAFSIVVGTFGRYSWPATIAVVVPGAVALVFAWRSPLEAVPQPEPSAGRESFRARGVIAWIGLFVALGLFELTNLLLQPSLTTDSYAHPTLSVLTDPVLASHAGRSVVLFLWLAFGWFLSER
jgi:hypothetical protein